MTKLCIGCIVDGWAGRNGPAELVKRAHFLRVAVSPTGPCSDLSPPARPVECPLRN